MLRLKFFKVRKHLTEKSVIYNLQRKMAAWRATGKTVIRKLVLYPRKNGLRRKSKVCPSDTQIK